MSLRFCVYECAFSTFLRLTRCRQPCAHRKVNTNSSLRLRNCNQLAAHVESSGTHFIKTECSSLLRVLFPPLIAHFVIEWNFTSCKRMKMDISYSTRASSINRNYARFARLILSSFFSFDFDFQFSSPNFECFPTNYFLIMTFVWYFFISFLRLRSQSIHSSFSFNSFLSPYFLFPNQRQLFLIEKLLFDELHSKRLWLLQAKWTRPIRLLNELQLNCILLLFFSTFSFRFRLNFLYFSTGWSLWNIYVVFSVFLMASNEKCFWCHFMCAQPQLKGTWTGEK